MAKINRRTLGRVEHPGFALTLALDTSLIEQMLSGHVDGLMRRDPGPTCDLSVGRTRRGKRPQVVKNLLKLRHARLSMQPRRDTAGSHRCSASEAILGYVRN